MPHIVIEYSEGAVGRINMPDLVRAVHRSVRESGMVKPNAVRTFARESTYSLVADEDPDNQFVQIILRIAPGRSTEDKKRILKTVYDAAENVARPALKQGRCAVRADLIESDPEFAIHTSSLP
ncbi:5-carboxymethyl-2-hydroxymuconate Delta-isomerase (plasmid) [Agrobacterium tumefaciens]|uniref:5-carboxymethyl-2-hydroxymuconate Delta-isomerase n=1 Tax=Agrobacterium tumefaciens TaxID=358 RepID=A0AAP9E9T6_AGRTU|nr:5-carboxymethyl-2-hydroxymuconate Delta-isomerase [Agrobacterium tumefaciens]NSZ60051.1 5-carboxymethyl-2-hydroxymuconate Delta-isomerase [Agrobacterium tumefaciens]QDY97653.1 5-carboxymethyl-2-hydroxymuconate Delta-isomerase [Agrobacterium tumefaciens]UXS12776.1 5-carboxymethyl-2-hydroxymuconate Delta-isomerase [Agrobacterium tumefaciens]UXS20138.1 5-carboxymethyl-2-hydroxymuconate Delta-isomerase [Agrobacterium tumefaciens]UXS27785.1 5-carboxymethyl-2-hydroxymuconate Delta-isomerase [Agro